jgi:MoaA/NifB/PqqE/SkfB family radical SAM enzyme
VPALLPFPRRINVELTNHCNQRCPLCPRQAFTRPLGFMEVSLFEAIARESGAHDAKLWLHFLGEPLLHRHAPAMVGLAKGCGVREVGLSTNAVALGTYADALLDAGLDRLECSMDAVDRAGYSAMRGRDHFARAADNVRAFLARKRERRLDKPVVSVQFMRTPAVEAALREIVAAWGPHLGARDFIMTIAPVSFGGAISLPSPASHDTPRNGARPPCPWLFDSLVILQDGTVTMCGADWDARAPLGNRRDRTIAAIWHGPEIMRRRAAHLSGRFEAVGPCAECTDWRLADGSGYVNVLRELGAP